MTSSLPLLDPLPLPSPAWLMSALLAVTFALHVLAMNLLLGGSVIGVAARIRGRRDGHAAALAGLVASALPAVFAATITFGVAPLLFLQALYGRVFFAGAVLLAGPWLLMVPLVIAAYCGTYLMARGPGIAGSVAVGLLVLIVAFIQSNVMSAMTRPQAFVPWFLETASGLRLNLGDPTLAPRFLHVVIGAAAVGGAGVALAGHTLRSRDPALSTWMIRHGVLWCAGATTLNLLPGFWWFAALPTAVMLRFMGRDWGSTLWLVGGIVSALAALGHLIPAAMTKTPRSLLVGGAGSLAASVACMVMVRDAARRAALEAAGLQPATWVAPEWGAIAMFFALLIGAVATVGWMVRALLRAPKAEPEGV